jgi:pimeloyl-ACP methyl ester carboxylesterase
MAAFWADWRVYELDHRGHGRGGYRIVDFAADTIEFLRRRIERPAVLVGHSLGAMIAIAVAAEAPDLVRAAESAAPACRVQGPYERCGGSPTRTVRSGWYALVPSRG